MLLIAKSAAASSVTGLTIPVGSNGRNVRSAERVAWAGNSGPSLRTWRQIAHRAFLVVMRSSQVGHAPLHSSLTKSVRDVRQSAEGDRAQPTHTIGRSHCNGGTKAVTVEAEPPKATRYFGWPSTQHDQESGPNTTLIG
jgi:hypothetical protein